MSLVITLRACLVAGGVALTVALTGCDGTTTGTAPGGPSSQRLDLDLPVGGPTCAPAGEGVRAAAPRVLATPDCN